MKKVIIWITATFTASFLLFGTLIYLYEYVWVEINEAEKQWCSENKSHLTYRECELEFIQ